MIKGTATPIYVPPTLALPPGGELTLVLIAPRVPRRKDGPVKIDTAFSEAADALGVTREAAKKRIYRAFRSNRLVEIDREGADHALRGDSFYRWLHQ